MKGVVGEETGVQTRAEENQKGKGWQVLRTGLCISSLTSPVNTATSPPPHQPKMLHHTVSQYKGILLKYSGPKINHYSLYVSHFYQQALRAQCRSTRGRKTHYLIRVTGRNENGSSQSVHTVRQPVSHLHPHAAHSGAGRQSDLPLKTKQPCFTAFPFLPSYNE